MKVSDGLVHPEPVAVVPAQFGQFVVRRFLDDAHDPNLKRPEYSRSLSRNA